MTSEINTASLNENFPVAGVNNDSRGFRDNFLSIKHGLDTAASEITELQNRSGFTGSMGDVGYTGSTIVNGYTGSASTEIGYTGSFGDTGYTGSRGIGYTGSASTVVGYAGSKGYAGSAGAGFTGSASAVNGPTGFTGSASTISGPQGPTGFTGSASSASGPQGPTGFTGSASTVSGPQGPTGFTGSAGAGYTGSAGTGGGGGSALSYQTTSFTATTNTQYVVDTTGGSITITLPATPSTGDYITFTAKYLQTNTVTVTDGDAVNDLYDKTIDGAKYYYDGATWQRIEDGTVRSYTNTSNYYEVAVFDDNASNLLHTTPVTIDYSTGQMTIPAPTSGDALSVTGTSPDLAIVATGGARTVPEQAVQVGSSITLDASLSNVFYTTLSQSITSVTIDNASSGQTINWFIIVPAETSRTVTFPAGWKWANSTVGVITSEAYTTVDLVTLTYMSFNSSWHASIINNFD